MGFNSAFKGLNAVRTLSLFAASYTYSSGYERQMTRSTENSQWLWSTWRIYQCLFGIWLPDHSATECYSWSSCDREIYLSLVFIQVGCSSEAFLPNFPLQFQEDFG